AGCQYRAAEQTCNVRVFAILYRENECKRTRGMTRNLDERDRGIANDERLAFLQHQVAHRFGRIAEQAAGRFCCDGFPVCGCRAYPCAIRLQESSATVMVVVTMTDQYILDIRRVEAERDETGQYQGFHVAGVSGVEQYDAIRG